MGQNKYQKSRKFIQYLIEKYGTKTIKFDVILAEIKIFFGSDEKRTVAPTVQSLREWGFVTREGDTGLCNLVIPLEQKGDS